MGYWLVGLIFIVMDGLNDDFKALEMLPYVWKVTAQDRATHSFVHCRNRYVCDLERISPPNLTSRLTMLLRRYLHCHHIYRRTTRLPTGMGKHQSEYTI